MADKTAESYLNKTYTLAQLKEQLTQRDLETSGKKADLVSRLANYLTEYTEDPLAALAGIEAEDVCEVEDPVKTEEPEQTESMETDAQDADAQDTESQAAKPEEASMETEEKTAEKAETKADDKMVMLNGRSAFKKDQNLDIRKRSVVVGPIGPEEFARPEFETYAKETLSFFVRLNWDETNQKSWGHVEMRFKTPERAVEVVDEFPKFREDLQVRRLGMAVNAEMVDREFKGIDVDREDPDIRTLAACNIPSTANEEEIRSRFSDAKSILVAKDEEGNFQGRVYLEFSSSDEADTHLLKYCTGNVEFEGKKTSFSRVTTVPKSKRILDHFEHNKKGGEGQVLHPTKRQNFQQRLQDFESKLKDYTGNLSAAKRNHLESQVHYIKKRLAEDDDLRKKRGLPPADKTNVQRNIGRRPTWNRPSGHVRGRGGYSPRGHAHGPPPAPYGRGHMGPGPRHGPPHRPPPPGPRESNTTATAMQLISTLGNMLSSTMSGDGTARGRFGGGSGSAGPAGRYGNKGMDDYGYGQGRGGYGSSRGGHSGYGGYDSYGSGGGYGGYGRGAKRMRTKSGNY